MSAASQAPRAVPRPVVLTGYGTVDASGCGKEALRRTFSAAPRLTEVDMAAGYHRTDASRHAALVDPASMSDWLAPRQARRMSPPSRFAVAATRIAWQDAGLPIDDAEALQALGARTAVVSSTAYGPSSFTESLLRQILLGDPSQASPFLFTEAVANAPAAQVALLLKARGPNITVTQREAGPLMALAKAAAEIRRGRVDYAVVAAVDEANPLLHAVLDRFGVLAGSRGRGEVARPFDAERRGFVLAEGSTVCILEGADTAAARGARILGRVGPLIAGFDAGATPAGFGTGAEVLARRLKAGLERQGIAADEIDLVVSGAAGGRTGDELEAGVLRRVWPESMPPVFAPKAYSGEHGGGLLAGLAAALDGFEVAPSPGFETFDPDLGVRPFAGGRLCPGRRVLAGAPAVGGSAAWLLVDTSEAGP